MKLGFIGLGNMGEAMARHIWDKREDRDQLFIKDQRRQAASQLEKTGAIWCQSNRELAKQAQIIGIMVPDVPQIRDVLAGPDGIIAGVNDKGEEETIAFVSSTISGQAIRELAQEASEQTSKKLHLIDAPVSGGQRGAQEGSLSIMVGASEKDYQIVEPILRRCGTPLRLGPLGSGQVAKACNQLICAATIAGIAEASLVADKAGLDVKELFELLQGGYAQSVILKDKGPRFVQRNYEVSGAAWLWIKDLKSYLSEAEHTGVQSLLGHQLLQAFAGIAEAGWGKQDTAVIQKWLEERPKN